MSHTATVEVEFKDKDSLKKAVEDMGGSVKFADKNKKLSVKLYSETKQAEMSIKLPGWRYSIAINGGKASFDNYEGSWGKMDKFDSMKQGYATEVAAKKARRLGFTVNKVEQDDGSIQLRCSR